MNEGRVFNEKWTDKYFFVTTNNTVLCLICKGNVLVSKYHNLKRHYFQKHAAKFDKYQGTLCKDKRAELKKNLSSQQFFLKNLKLK